LIPILAIYLAPSRESIVVKAFDSNLSIKCANPYGDGYCIVSKLDGWEKEVDKKHISFKYGVILTGIERCYNIKNKSKNNM